MKSPLRLLLVAVAFAGTAAVSASCAKHAAPAAASAQPAAAKRHPLRGVVVDVRPADSALLVKHEDIPGVMPAMTMLFKVDAATLKAAAKDQRIAATLVERDDGFWLEDVKPAP